MCKFDMSDKLLLKGPFMLCFMQRNFQFGSLVFPVFDVMAWVMKEL